MVKQYDMISSYMSECVGGMYVERKDYQFLQAQLEQCEKDKAELLEGLDYYADKYDYGIETHLSPNVAVRLINKHRSAEDEKD